jgi:hypothetical protein
MKSADGREFVEVRRRESCSWALVSENELTQQLRGCSGDGDVAGIVAPTGL